MLVFWIFFLFMISVEKFKCFNFTGWWWVFRMDSSKILIIFTASIPRIMQFNVFTRLSLELFKWVHTSWCTKQTLSHDIFIIKHDRRHCRTSLPGTGQTSLYKPPFKQERFHCTESVSIGHRLYTSYWETQKFTVQRRLQEKNRISITHSHFYISIAV